MFNPLPKGIAAELAQEPRSKGRANNGSDVAKRLSSQSFCDSRNDYRHSLSVTPETIICLSICLSVSLCLSVLLLKPISR